MSSVISSAGEHSASFQTGGFRDNVTLNRVVGATVSLSQQQYEELARQQQAEANEVMAGIQAGFWLPNGRNDRALFYQSVENYRR